VQKRIRGVLAGLTIFDTITSLLVWESKWHAQYWIPRSAFAESVTFTPTPSISGIQTSTAKLTVRDKTVDALVVPEAFNSPLAGHVKVSFKALEQWFEEQSLIIHHPKDPFHRVDTLPTDRSIRVELNGVVLADTGAGGGVMSLWETGFPARWYLPRTAVRWEYLTESDTKTGCPYKGEASYYNVKLEDGTEVKDAVWWYKSPIKESGEIIGMACFYPEKVEYFINGVKAGTNGMPVVEEKVGGVAAEVGSQDPTREVRENGHEVRSCNC
jgi:uncharacterized protein (DUF427 family)